MDPDDELKRNQFFKHDAMPCHDVLQTDNEEIVIQDKTDMLRHFARYLINHPPTPLFRKDYALLLWHFFTLGRMKFWEKYSWLLLEPCPNNQQQYYENKDYYDKYMPPDVDKYIHYSVDETKNRE